MLYNNDYRNVKLNEIVDFVIVDIPYNLGTKAYASSNEWWLGKDFKNGKSEKANSCFFNSDINFNIEEMLQYIY